VQKVAAELDELYTQVRYNLGLPPASDAKIALKVVVEAAPIRRAQLGHQHQPIVVVSPVLLLAPDSLTEEAILRQSILLHLVNHAGREAFSNHWIPSRWHSLFNAVRLWQLWDLGGALAGPREPLLRWLYVDVPGRKGDSHPPLPSNYAELCALYAVWDLVPIQTAIPFVCNNRDPTRLYMLVKAHLLAAGDRPDGFANLIPPPSDAYDPRLPHERYGSQPYGQDGLVSLLMVSLLDYIAATYGRADIRALWSALPEHDDWQTLMPAVFGVSAVEFEAGWQAYLDEMFHN
jgi:hypothetical protein